MAFTVYFIRFLSYLLLLHYDVFNLYLKSTYPVGPIDLCFASFDLISSESTYIYIRGTLY